MDRKFSNKVKLDDTVALMATIETFYTIKGHTEYAIRVQRGPLAENCWKTKKRYNDFVELQKALQLTNMEISLPPKKIFGNMEREFVSQRQQGLQNYLNAVLAHPVLAAMLPVKKFLDPVNYFYNFQEKSYQQVLMMFRSDHNWQITQQVQDMGWRIRKQYFIVCQQRDPLQEYLLSRNNYGIDLCLSEKEVNLIFKLLSSISHPHILSPNVALTDSSGAVSISNFYAEGSLKDLIYKSNPKDVYLKKYKPFKKGFPLSKTEIKSFGRQILEALHDLHLKGLPYGHLHSGNVIIDNGGCRISSLENAFLGLPSFYRTFALQLKKVKSLTDLDVYSFGHLLYEMTFGESLNSPTCDVFPSSCPPEIKCVLESILTTEACKCGLPTVEHLLTHPLFEDTKNSSKSHIRIPSPMQELCKMVENKIEQRLIDDQNLIRKVQRLYRAQSVLHEENRLGFKKQTLSLRKIKGNGSTETRSVSPVESCGKNSLTETASLPTLDVPNNNVQILNETADTSDRSALLNSIQGFNTNTLRKAHTNDRSGAAV